MDERGDGVGQTPCPSDRMIPTVPQSRGYLDNRIDHVTVENVQTTTQ